MPIDSDVLTLFRQIESEMKAIAKDVAVQTERITNVQLVATETKSDLKEYNRRVLWWALGLLTAIASVALGAVFKVFP